MFQSIGIDCLIRHPLGRYHKWDVLHLFSAELGPYLPNKTAAYEILYLLYLLLSQTDHDWAHNQSKDNIQ